MFRYSAASAELYLFPFPAHFNVLQWPAVKLKQ